MSPTREHGLLIGKFYPPHAGHNTAIRQGVAECTAMSVVVMASVAETIPLAHRVAWLRETHPDVDVTGVVCDGPLDVDDDAAWVAQVEAMHAALRTSPTAGTAGPVDTVYSGDDYGEELARRFDATFVRMTREGAATAVRHDLAGHWDKLAPATQAGLATRVVVVGAESTGTTTVSRALAEAFRARGGVWERTQWVGEYGRELTQIKWQRDGGRLDDLVWRADDFDAVGTEQVRREEAAARIGSPLLVCDTDAFATAVWERRYLGDAARDLQPWATATSPAVYLVTDHEGVPWLDDGMREGDLAVRSAMTTWFTDALTRAGRSWVLLSGDLDTRVDFAIRTTEQVLAIRSRFGEPLHGPGFAPTAL